LATCPSCKTHYDVLQAAFCGNCGHRLGEDGAAPAADPLIGMVIDGRYRILDLIGRGGMGAVYRVEHVKMGKIMAMKLLHGELSRDVDIARRFRREAQAVSQLSHPNTVSVFDFGAYQGLTYLVMEYIDGRDLSETQRLEGPLDPRRVVAILVQVCSGLIEAHGKGIVHRDLKPENIIVGRTQDGQEFAKVVDFGLAELKFGLSRTRITAQGSLVGTPYYMSPEHIRGESVDARTDIYALGAVFFKLLTGAPPFFAPTPMGIITKHLVDPVEPPSRRCPELGLPPEADAIVLKAMAKSPDDRYASAEEMRRALIDLAARLGVPAITGFGSSVGALGDPRPTAVDAAPADPGVTPIVTYLPTDRALDGAGAREAPEAERPSTVTIGARELQIGTRSDVASFRRRKRFRRAIAISLGIVGLLAAAAGGVYMVVFLGRDDSIQTVETEPNDAEEDADTLTPGVALAGYLATAGSAGDADWFRLNGPPRGEWAVEVQVSGVPGADLALQLVAPGALGATATANAGGAGAGEEIAPVVVDAPYVFLVVQEVRRPGVPAGSFAAQPYTVAYRIYDPSSVEREPNDTQATATPSRVGAPVIGRLGSSGDVDWYCSPAGREVASVQVSGVPGIDIELDVRIGESSVETLINGSGAGGGESIALPKNTGPVCVAVRRRAAIGSPQPPQATLGSPYQVLFQ
jgi:tRNA A-37 threonylcarbamoyl transferase component Bud32